MPHLQGNRGLIIALFLLIFSVYLASYSGRSESGDSLRVADATSSLVHFNDLLRDETVWEEPPQDVFASDLRYPFASYDPSQPFIVYASSILFRIAELFPELGLAHAMWLLNIFIIASCGICFFIYARLWGYGESVAIAGTLIFALATIVWPYSKTLFREPLAMFMLLLTALSLEKWKSDYRRFWWLLLAVVGMIAAILSKDSSIFAIPAFFVLALPKLHRPSIGNILLLLGLIAILFFALVPNSFEPLQQVLRPIRRFSIEYSQVALWTYLFSIGGSLWATSPVLLLGFGGAVLLFKEGQRQHVYWIVLLLISYSFAHALFSDVHWFGGLSWPPRFLVPVVPFVALLILPVVEWLLQPNRRLWLGLALLLAFYSMTIQLIAVISWQDAYVQLLPVESGGLVEWQGGLNELRYLRWLLLPQSWASVGFDIAWMRSGAPSFAWFFAGLAVASAFVIWQKRYRWFVVVIAVLIVAGLGLGLRHLYHHDPQYWAQKSALFEMLAILERESENGEPLLLAGSADVSYERFILNYNRYRSFRPTVLGFQPGEVTSADDSPRSSSYYVTDLLGLDISGIIDDLANRHERFWWLAHNGPFTPWAIRPEERYLVENYYLLDSHSSEDPTVRLLEFSTVRAPNPYDFRLPENLTELRFGDSIRLNGFTLPLGTEYAAGDVVPISLFWETDTLVEQDYTISWFIVSETGQAIIQGMDSQPKGGFALTNTWQANQFIIDNRAIELPADTPAGRYVMWLRLYVTGSEGSNALPITQGEAYEANLGVLPLRLSIN
jgi:hypothetical protein